MSNYTTAYKDCQELSTIFVHGTLKKGGYNWKYFIEDAEFLGEAVTHGRYIMTDVGFPYIFPEEVVREWETGLLRHVHGHLFKVTPKQLTNLDMLEGIPDHFQRRKITTQCGKEAWVYCQENILHLHHEDIAGVNEEGHYEW